MINNNKVSDCRDENIVSIKMIISYTTESGYTEEMEKKLNMEEFQSLLSFLNKELKMKGTKNAKTRRKRKSR